MKLRYSGVARRTLSAPMLVALLALVVATSGTTYAALSVTGHDVVDGSLTTKDVQNRSLLKKDFKKGQLPAGPAGPAGPTGPAGAKGEPGTTGQDGQDGSPDTPAQVLAKVSQVDGTGSELDADKLDGKTSAEFVQGRAAKVAVALSPGVSVGLFSFSNRVFIDVLCADPLQSNSTISVWNLANGPGNFFIDDGTSTPVYAPLEPNTHVPLPALPAGEMLNVHAQWGDGAFASLTISSVHRASDCHFQASGVLLP